MTVDTTLATRIDTAVEQHRARAHTIHRSWRAYEGEKPERIRGDDTPTDEIRLNLAGLIVDTGVDFLFGKDLTIDVDDPVATDDRDTYLDEAWGRRRMTLLQAAAIHGAVAGHAILRIVPVEGADPRTTPPRIITLDPANVIVITADDDLETVLAQVVMWGTEHDRHRQILEPQGQSWSITEQRRGSDHGRWVTVQEITWPHAWSPVAGCQNLLRPGAYWGRPDLTADVLDTQDAVNESLSRTSRKDRLQNKRLLVGKGLDTEAADQLSEGDAVLLQDGESDLYAIDAAGGTVRDSLELYRTVKAALHEISRVPEIAAGRLDNIGQLSGLALQILYGPLVRKTESKRRTYGGLIEDMSARLLEVAGYGPADSHHIGLRWPAVLPVDDEAQARVAMLRQDAGVSRGTTLAELGYDAAAEAAAVEEERLAGAESAERMFDRGVVDGG